jgi:hypothetical protein
MIIQDGKILVGNKKDFLKALNTALNAIEDTDIVLCREKFFVTNITINGCKSVHDFTLSDPPKRGTYKYVQWRKDIKKAKQRLEKPQVIINRFKRVPEKVLFGI